MKSLKWKFACPLILPLLAITVPLVKTDAEVLGSWTIGNDTIDLVRREPATKPAATLPVVIVPIDVVKPATLPATVRIVEVPAPSTKAAGVRPAPFVLANLKAADANAFRSDTTYGGLAFSKQVTLTGLKNTRLVGCQIDAKGADFGVRADNCTNVTIEGCEILNAKAAGIYGSGFSALGNYIHHIAGDGIKPNRDVVIQGNYVAFLGWNNATAHADGVQIPGGANFRIVGNYFDMGRDVPGTKSNAAVFAQGDFSNLVVESNWIRGGNYSIHAYDDGPDNTSRISGNTFYSGSSQYGFGHISSSIPWTLNVNELGKAATTGSK